MSFILGMLSMFCLWDYPEEISCEQMRVTVWNLDERDGLWWTVWLMLYHSLQEPFTPNLAPLGAHHPLVPQHNLALIFWSCLLFLFLFHFPNMKMKRWPKYWSFSFNISPSNEHPGLISFHLSAYLSYSYLTSRCNCQNENPLPTPSGLLI